MTQKKRKKSVLCQICTKQAYKYTCPQCHVIYCSLECYKEHKGPTCSAASTTDYGIHQTEDQPRGDVDDSQSLSDTGPLRPLTDLKWPYVPEESAFPDPLKRDDPKPLQLSHYESIGKDSHPTPISIYPDANTTQTATSPRIRQILSSHEQLPALLTTIDKLRGADREEALQKALGVTQIDRDGKGIGEVDEEVTAFRKLAEAVEEAVRGGKEGLGLDWGD